MTASRRDPWRWACLAALSCLASLGASPTRLPQRPVAGPTFATVLGGPGTDDCDGIGIDHAGAIYLGCHSHSPALPTGGSPPYTLRGDMDAFVIKLTPDGRRVQYLTHLGGSKWDAISDVVVDSRGYAYVVGSTLSPSLSTAATPLRTRSGGPHGDAFAARLSPSGVILWFTYLGGNDLEDAARVVIDEAGNAYVTGRTDSRDFPTTAGAAQPRLRGQTDAYIAKLDSAGRIVYATYLGGSSDDVAMGIAVDRNGNAHVTGDTRSPDFPLERAPQTKKRGSGDCFVSIISADGTRVLFSTYWGGSAWDYCTGIALDAAGRVYVTGVAHSGDFPVTRGAFQLASGGGGDAFAAAFEPMVRALVYSTYLGGRGLDEAAQVSAGERGRAWIAGTTVSPDFPTARASQVSPGGSEDGFVALLDSNGTTLLFSTYLGGRGRENFEDGVAAPDGGFLVSGFTTSPDFPTVGSVRRTSRNASDIFDIVVAKFRAR